MRTSTCVFSTRNVEGDISFCTAAGHTSDIRGRESLRVVFIRTTSWIDRCRGDPVIDFPRRMWGSNSTLRTSPFQLGIASIIVRVDHYRRGRFFSRVSTIPLFCVSLGLDPFLSFRSYKIDVFLPVVPKLVRQ